MKAVQKFGTRENFCIKHLTDFGTHALKGSSSLAYRIFSMEKLGSKTISIDLVIAEGNNRREINYD